MADVGRRFSRPGRRHSGGRPHLSVAGRDVNTWEQFFIAIGTRPDRETDLVLLRDGKEVPVKVTPKPETRFEVGDIGVHPGVASARERDDRGRASRKGGLKAGDVILGSMARPSRCRRS